MEPGSVLSFPTSAISQVLEGHRDIQTTKTNKVSQGCAAYAGLEFDLTIYLLPKCGDYKHVPNTWPPCPRDTATDPNVFPC